MERALMRKKVVLGVDIGTSSSKGVLVTFEGSILRSAVRAHSVERPFPGHVEMSAEIWWQEFVDIATELTLPGDVDVVSVGVSGLGPCVLVTDERSRPPRPAILYGVDTRATAQIDALNAAIDQLRSSTAAGQRSRARQSVRSWHGCARTSQLCSPRRTGSTCPARGSPTSSRATTSSTT